MSARQGIVACVVVVVAALAPGAARAARIVVTSADAAGEGFSDPTPVVPAGGNAATTLGAARLAALQFAADRWGARLDSAVTIEVRASFNPLTCTPSSAVLGQAGPTTVHRDFPSAPRPSVWYAQALANSLARADLDPANPDISANFNATLDGGTCLGGRRWYYGLNSQPPADGMDFVTTATHELGHGLGFLAFVDLDTGAKLLGFDDAFTVSLERHGATPSGYPQMTDAQRAAANQAGAQLHWVGPILDGAAATALTAGTDAGHVLMYAPSPVRPGASLSHFATTVAPNELMEPFFTGTNHELGLTAKLLQDTGWRTASALVPALPPRSFGLLALALGLVVVGVGVRRRAGG